MSFRGLVLSIVLMGPADLPAQAPDARLSKLPAGLREQGQAVLQETDARKRAELADALFRKHGPALLDFLLAVLETEPSAQLRTAMVDRLGRTGGPQIAPLLKRTAAADPDPKVSVLALERLRMLEARSMLQLLDERLRMASGNEADRRLLAAEKDRWIAFSKGGALPAFMHTPPPVFSVKPQGQPIRVLAFGDYGQGTETQQRTARAMLAYHRRNPFDLAITLGDNFYPRGMASPGDPRWKTWWSELYDPLGIKFYTSLGNHDWGLPDSPAAEVVYSYLSPSWRMPATRYTFTAGPVQFFALDTDAFGEGQAIWLKDELEKSKAAWKVVYGHHPIYSHGVHGDTKSLVAALLPVLKGRAQLYLAGHDHDLQHLKPEGDLHFVIAGGGGAGVRPITAGPRSLFAASSNGFAVLEARASEMKIRMVSDQPAELYEHTLRK